MKYELNKEGVNGLDELVTGVGYPPLYQLHLYNDDFTPMDFVVTVLEVFFCMERRQAVSAMMEAHQTGSVMCGVFGKDVAETKMSQILDYAVSHEHPLNCRMEAA